MSALPLILVPLALGVLLGAAGLPLPWSVLTPLPLAAVLAYVASGRGRQVGGRMFWAGFGYTAVHLWWLTAFLGKIFGFPPLGVLALALYAIEGGFLAGMALLVGRVWSQPTARVWGLAGGWVLLEWLRFLGPLAFPWPTLGYTLLGTPLIQVADLGGVLLGSVLVCLVAAVLAQLALNRGQWGVARPAVLAAVSVAVALVYGLTRQPAAGQDGQALILRTTIDSFDKANQMLSAEQQFELSARLTRQYRQPGETVIWSETAIQNPALLNRAPAGGLYGIVGYFQNGVYVRANRVIGWDGQQITSQNHKARPVPFGEYFPLRRALNPLWQVIERRTGILLESTPPASTMTPLLLGGVKYGAYVCYDSVFPWVARQLARRGATVLVNVSNDGWYDGWGVQQHFMMGRVRAIENRRWVLRSVNLGITAVIDDLGRPVQTLDRGEGALHARYRLLTGRTVYQRVGDWPALLLASLMLLYAARQERRAGR